MEQMDMQDSLQKLNEIKRPRLLVEAARLGESNYARDRHLRRVFGPAHPSAPRATLPRLEEMEREINELRVARDGRYSPIRHIDLLIAIMGEARLHVRLNARQHAPAQEVAPGPQPVD
jgi:hypothetical protein